jgi:uncharacterized membrane protein YebE (DUF533 family)
MFDAKNLLESLVRGAGSRSRERTSDSREGGLGDLLGQLTRGTDAPTREGAPQSGGLGDLLRNLQSGQGGGGGLGDLLRNLQQQGGQGGLAETLRQVLGQATQGTREGAGRLGEATGAREAITRMSGGRSPEDLLAQLKDLMASNQLGTGAALGGLGGLLLGSRTGRSAAMSAAKLGALALIGGLAYTAYRNYSQGKPPVAGVASLNPDEAPEGTGFEPQAVSNESAMLYIRAMIAAAAADGRIDEAEQAGIVEGLRQSGLDAEAEAFLEDELKNPASAANLAAAVGSREQALQVYTAARLAIDPDTEGERTFLSGLARALRLEGELASHVDAAARSASA